MRTKRACAQEAESEANLALGLSESYLGRLRAEVGSTCLLVPGARVVVKRQDRCVLMQHRSDLDVWGFLAGMLKRRGQSLAICETMEETGVRIWNLRPFGFGSDPDYETVTLPTATCQFFVMMFYATDYEGVPVVADDESKAVDWVDLRAMPVMLPNLRRSIETFSVLKRRVFFK